MKKHFWDGKKRKYHGWGKTVITICGRHFNEADKMLDTKITTTEEFVMCNTCIRILKQKEKARS